MIVIVSRNGIAGRGKFDMHSTSYHHLFANLQSLQYLYSVSVTHAKSHLLLAIFLSIFLYIYIM